MKTGIEIEGRLKGIKSLFVSTHEIQELGTEKVIQTARENGVAHIEIPQDIIVNLSDPMFNILHTAGFIVTTETTEIVGTTPDFLNVVLIVENLDFFKLRGIDQIKFVDKKLNVYMATVETMVRTYPHEFEADTPIKS